MSISIGVLVPRSDVYPLFSQNLVRGIKLAFEVTGVNVEFHIEDIGKGAVPDEVIGKANQLLIKDIDVCFAYVGHGCFERLADLFDKSQKPLIALHAGAKITYNESNIISDFVFQNSLQMWQSFYLMGKYFGQEYKKVISAFSFFDSGYQFSGAFQTGLQKSGADVVGFFSSNNMVEDDFKNRLVPLIKETEADAILSLFSGSLADTLYKICIEKGYYNNLPTIIMPWGIDLKSGHWDFAHTGCTWFKEIDTPSNTQFVEAFQNKHSVAPDAFAALAYESAVAVASTLKSNNSTANFCKSLKKGRYTGPRGEFAYDTQGTTLFSTYVMKAGAIIKQIMPDAQEIKNIEEEDKNGMSSGWYNPYPCS